MQAIALFLFISYLITSFNLKAKESPMIRVSGSTQEFIFQSAKAKSYQQFAFIHLFGDTLVTISSQGLIQSGIAKSWEILDAGQTYVFHINGNLKFHDGKKIRSRDIVSSFCRHLDPNLDSLFKPYLETILADPKVKNKMGECLSIYSQGEDKVVIKLKGAYPSFLSDIAYSGFSIYPENFDEKHPIGSGPYMLESNINNKIILKKFKNIEGQDSMADRFSFQIVREGIDIKKLFDENNLDLALGAPIQMVEDLHPEKIEFKYMNGLVSTNVYLNESSGLFSNHEIRFDLLKVLNTIKKDKTLFTKFDIPINTFLPEGIMPKEYYNRKNDTLSEQEFKTKHKINERKIRVVIPKHIFTDRFLERFKMALLNCGFSPIYTEGKGKVYLDPIEKGNFDLVLIPFMGLGTDPDGYLAMLDPDGLLKKVPLHTDLLKMQLDRFRFEVEPITRISNYSKSLKTYEEEYYVLPLVQQHLPFFFRKGLHVPDYNFNNFSLLREVYWSNK